MKSEKQLKILREQVGRMYDDEKPETKLSKEEWVEVRLVEWLKELFSLYRRKIYYRMPSV